MVVVNLKRLEFGEDNYNFWELSPLSCAYVYTKTRWVPTFKTNRG